MVRNIRRMLIAGALLSSLFPVRSWAGPNLLINGGFNQPAQGVPPGTPTAFTGCQFGGSSAAADWTTFVNSCTAGHDDLSTVLVSSTLPWTDGYMLHVITDGNANGIVQYATFDKPKTLTSIWMYINTGCVTVGTGEDGSTGPDATFCETGKWFHLIDIPNGVSPANEVIVYSGTNYLASVGADFYVKNAVVVKAN